MPWEASNQILPCWDSATNESAQHGGKLGCAWRTMRRASPRRETPQSSLEGSSVTTIKLPEGVSKERVPLRVTPGWCNRVAVLVLARQASLNFPKNKNKSLPWWPARGSGWGKLTPPSAPSSLPLPALLLSPSSSPGSWCQTILHTDFRPARLPFLLVCISRRAADMTGGGYSIAPSHEKLT